MSLVGVLVGIFVLIAAPKAEGADKIRIAFPHVHPGLLTWHVAQQKGFLRDSGIEAEIVGMRPNIIITALTAGEIDYTGLLGSVIQAAMRGMPVKAVATFMTSPTMRLVYQPEIQTADDFKGKTFAVNVIGDNADVTARLMLKHRFGIDAQKVLKILPLGPTGTRFHAMKQRIVDVSALSEPYNFEAKKLGFNVSPAAYDMFALPFSGLGVNLNKLKQKREEVRGVITAGLRANRYIRENRNGTIEVLMTWQKFDRETATLFYESVFKAYSTDGAIDPEGLRLTMDLHKKAGANEVTKPADVFDGSVLREAQAELAKTK